MLSTRRRIAEAGCAAHEIMAATQPGIFTEALPIISVGPATKIIKLILKPVRDTSADLVVIASYPLRMRDWILPSHGRHVAEQALISVFMIR